MHEQTAVWVSGIPIEDRRGPNQDPDIAPLPLVSVAAFYSDTKVAELLLKYGARLETPGLLRQQRRRVIRP